MMKVFVMRCDKVIRYARANLPPIMPNLKTLELGSTFEVNTPMLPSKFLNLKHLIIQVHQTHMEHESVFEGSSHLRQLPECHHDRLKSFEVTSPPMLPTKFLNLKHLAIQIYGAMSSQPYDYFALASFLDASPCLETWRLDVNKDRGKHQPVFGDSLHLRQLPKHLKLKSVEIIGFTSAKILVELACCIVKSAVSLERLTLNTFDSFGWCSGGNSSDCQDLCYRIEQDIKEEASRAVVAIRRYIEDKVPPTAKLTVLEPCPCSRCRSTHRCDK
nr:unnamed protein product [Digitaria exilis]